MKQDLANEVAEVIGTLAGIALLAGVAGGVTFLALGAFGVKVPFWGCAAAFFAGWLLIRIIKVAVK